MRACVFARLRVYEYLCVYKRARVCVLFIHILLVYDGSRNK